MAQVVEQLCGKLKAWSSTPSSTKIKPQFALSTLENIGRKWTSDHTSNLLAPCS
jgi:hypothetical protein